MLGKAYLLTGFATIAFYGFSAFSGWEYFNQPRGFVPAAQRKTKNWTRTTPIHYWHSGYRGGK